jgi:hypothetical protein
MDIDEIYNQLFTVANGSTEEDDLINELARLVGRSIKVVERAVRSCKRQKNTINGLKGCVERRLNLKLGYS